jgi:hypothetical protein
VSEAAFQQWRDQRDWTEQQYALSARGELILPRSRTA